MIERCAEALWKHTRNYPWSEAQEFEREEFLEWVQVMMVEMQEPTEAMCAEGADYLSVTPGQATNRTAGNVYEAMIAMAL